MTISSLVLNQLPAKGVPKIPTASSIQVRMRTRRIIPQISILNIIVLEDLTIKLIINAVPKRRIPAIRKSDADQFQPSTKIFPRKAVAKSNAGIAKMNAVFCCFVIILFNFKYFKVLCISKFNFKKN